MKTHLSVNKGNGDFIAVNVATWEREVVKARPGKHRMMF